MTPENLQQAQQYIDFVKNNLQPLAEHLKVGVEWLWQILVNQVRVEAIVYLAIIILLSIKSTTLLVIAFKSFKKARFYNYRSSNETLYIHKKTGAVANWDTWYDNKNNYDVVKADNRTNLQGYLVYWCGISGGVLMLFTAILSACSMPKIVTGLVNPEYGAMERIVQFSQGKVPTAQNK